MKRCEFRGGADAHRGGARVGGRSGVRRCQHATMHHVGHDGGCGGCRRGLGRRGAGRGRAVRRCARHVGSMVVHAAPRWPRPAACASVLKSHEVGAPRALHTHCQRTVSDIVCSTVSHTERSSALFHLLPPHKPYSVALPACTKRPHAAGTHTRRRSNPKTPHRRRRILSGDPSSGAFTLSASPSAGHVLFRQYWSALSITHVDPAKRGK